MNHFSKSLVYTLLGQRGSVGRRPIIFVAHSLGGMVCKEALNLGSKRQDLQSILTNTLGIIFMGTPHGGSHIAGWGNTVAEYVNVFRGTNRDILGNLLPGSSDIQRTEEDFQHMLLRKDISLKLYCFYEALKMNDIVGKIVERESAILPAYDNCSIDANHRTMTKFTGRADAGYSQVRGVLERWLKDREINDSHCDADQLENTSRAAHGASGAFYHSPVFNGPISGRYVIPGAQITGGTVNFNFPG